MKKSIFLIALAFLMTPFVWAQPTKEQKQQFKQLRKASHAYIKTEVMPHVKEWRKEFDSKLTPAEKQTIAEVRASLEEGKEAQKALRKELKALHKSGQEPSEQQKAQMQAMKEAHRANMAKLRPVVEAHKAALKEQREANQSYFDGWKKDLDALKQQYVGDLEPERKPRHPEMDREHGERGHRGGKGKGKHGSRRDMGKLKHFFSPKGFLLLDPDKEMPVEGLEMEDRGIEHSIKTFPNPANTSQSLYFELPESSYTHVELLDSQGNTIKTVTDGYRAAGQQQISVGINNLEPGIYFYRVTTDGGTVTKRFVKK